MWPDAEFFGCTGPRLRAAGVETVVDAASLAVVGLLEVVARHPADLRRVPEAAGRRPRAPAGRGHPHRFAGFSPAGGPAAASRRVCRWSIWSRRRPGRGAKDGSKRCGATCSGCCASSRSKSNSFSSEGVNATYIGHPLAGRVRPALSKDEFFRKHRLAPGRPLVAVLPGSRRGEAARHLPALLDAVDRLYREQAVNLVLPASPIPGPAFFRGTDRPRADPGDRGGELGRHGAR